MQRKLSFATKCGITLTQCILLLLTELAILTAFGEFSFLLADNDAISAVLFSKILSTPSLILPVLYFITVQFALHLFFVIYNLVLFTAMSDAHKRNFICKDRDYSVLPLYINSALLLLVNYFLLLIINNANYPNSTFAFARFIGNTSVVNVLSNAYLYTFACVWLTITTTISLLILFKTYCNSNKVLLATTFAVLGIIVYDKFGWYYLHKSNVLHASANKPNVVLITLDSFRYDHVNKTNPIDNQYLDIPKFVNNSVQFNNAYTPLARSFPALYSILSGNYPKTENIRFNLVNQDQIKFQNLLPSLLKANDYQTVYATDSSQFHIINKNWGYKQVIAPKQGIYEHILPRISDFPLSNLLMNYPISSYLFPYTYTNQSAYNIYNPLTYIDKITAKLDKLDYAKPFFFHFNFEAAHWPYQNRYLDSKLMYQDRYGATLNTVNWQVNQIFKYLTENDLLQNTVVVMASDHGESLGLVNDKLTNVGNYSGDSKYMSYVNKHPVNYTFAEIKDKNILDVILDINTSGGHGVDVLSKSQYQVIVAIQKFVNNKSVYSAKALDEPVVLNDLYPTILDLVNINKLNTADNMSLVPLINAKYLNSANTQTFTNRNIFIETDLQTPFLDKAELSDKNILTTFIQTWSKHYYINNRQYLELKPESIASLVKTKQYAVINNQNILAYIPSGLKQDWYVEPAATSNSSKTKLPECVIPRPVFDMNGEFVARICGIFKNTPGYYVFYNAANDKWTVYPNEESFKFESQVSNLYTNLKQQYQDEITNFGT